MLLMLMMRYIEYILNEVGDDMVTCNGIGQLHVTYFLHSTCTPKGIFVAYSIENHYYSTLNCQTLYWRCQFLCHQMWSISVFLYLCHIVPGQLAASLLTFFRFKILEVPSPQSVCSSQQKSKRKVT